MEEIKKRKMTSRAKQKHQTEDWDKEKDEVLRKGKDNKIKYKHTNEWTASPLTHNMKFSKRDFFETH